MQTLTDITELAKVCAAQARLTTSKDAARALWQLATEYQERAAKFDGGRLPDLGDPPALLK
jgi:hypothetical protein